MPDASSLPDPTRLFRLDGRAAVVTGASSGMGVEFARALAAAGARVVLAARRTERLETLADEIRKAGGQALAVACDVAREEDVEALAERAWSACGRIDVLVNNAGYNTLVPAEQQSLADWRGQIDVNLTGVFLCAQRFGRRMLEAGGGSIVNVASIRAVVAGGRMVQYDTTKAAVAGLTRALALDHATEGIRVNAVCPGPIFTRFHERRAVETGKSADEFRAEFGRGTMLKRPGTPAEVAACILFLASDDASYVTGASLFVDGGHVSI
jgi:NAD(P)-dependent dehydrogenase (short-subunit alcohol dehydrogenase family)